MSVSKISRFFGLRIDLPINQQPLSVNFPGLYLAVTTLSAFFHIPTNFIKMQFQPVNDFDPKKREVKSFLGIYDSIDPQYNFFISRQPGVTLYDQLSLSSLPMPDLNRFRLILAKALVIRQHEEERDSYLHQSPPPVQDIGERMDPLLPCDHSTYTLSENKCKPYLQFLGTNETPRPRSIEEGFRRKRSLGEYILTLPRGADISAYRKDLCMRKYCSLVKSSIQIPIEIIEPFTVLTPSDPDVLAKRTGRRKKSRIVEEIKPPIIEEKESLRDWIAKLGEDKYLEYLKKKRAWRTKGWGEESAKLRKKINNLGVQIDDLEKQIERELITHLEKRIAERPGDKKRRHYNSSWRNTLIVKINRCMKVLDNCIFETSLTAEDINIFASGLPLYGPNQKSVSRAKDSLRISKMLKNLTLGIPEIAPKPKKPRKVVRSREELRQEQREIIEKKLAEVVEISNRRYQLAPEWPIATSKPRPTKLTSIPKPPSMPRIADLNIVREVFPELLKERHEVLMQNAASLPSPAHLFLKLIQLQALGAGMESDVMTAHRYTMLKPEITEVFEDQWPTLPVTIRPYKLDGVRGQGRHEPKDMTIDETSQNKTPIAFISLEEPKKQPIKRGKRKRKSENKDVNIEDADEHIENGLSTLDIDGAIADEDKIDEEYEKEDDDDHDHDAEEEKEEEKDQEEEEEEEEEEGGGGGGGEEGEQEEKQRKSPKDRPRQRWM